MTTYALMPSTLGGGLDHLHQLPHRSMHPVQEQEPGWYLPAFNESSSWMDHEPSTENYAHAAPAATSASHSHPVWAVSHHGSQAGDYDTNSTYAYSHSSSTAPDNAYLTPTSSVIDLTQQRSNQSNLHSYMDHHEHSRSMTHSPVMQTYMSTSSDAGSVYADGTPPPPTSAFYQQHAEDVSRAATLSAIPEQPRLQPRSQTSQQDPRAGNRRRSSPPSKVAARPSSSAADSKEAADKVRERRSGHSAVERKYRENLNGKIEVLRQVLIEAHRNYDSSALSGATMPSPQHRATDMSMTHTARHVALTSKEGHPPPDSVITFAATIGSKKSDVLSTAIHYIKEAEQSRSVLLQQVAFLQSQVVKLEGVLCGGASDYNGGGGSSSSNGGGSANATAASQRGNDGGGSSSSMT